MVSLDDIKSPPNSYEAEQAMIGCIFLDPEIMHFCELQEERLFDNQIRLVFSAMRKLHVGKKGIDVVNVINLIDQEYRDSVYELTTASMSTANRKDYQETIKQNFLRRKMLKMAQAIEGATYDKNVDVASLQEKIRRSLDDSFLAPPGEEFFSGAEKMIQEMGVIQPYISKYGYSSLDKYVGGYKPGQLVVIGGRPGTGKTAVMLELLQRAVNGGINCAVYSLEMTNNEVFQRLLSNRASVDMQEISYEKHKERLLEVYNEHIGNGFNFYCFDNIYLRKDLETSLRKAAMIDKCQLAFIDHVGLIKGQGQKNRNERIGSITSSLKTLAKELKMTIVLLSQLNRNSAKAYDVPQLSDLRDSGSIEQDADIVLMLHRDRDDEDDNYDLNKLELFIRKNRNGKLGVMKMLTQMEYMRLTQAPNEKKKKPEAEKEIDVSNDKAF